MRRTLVLVAALAGCAGPPLQSDWELAHISQLAREDAVPPPRYPRESDLIALDVAGASGFRFYVDGATLSVRGDHIVRYVLVGRSPAGVDNVTFEGMRCATGEFRIYAVGRADGGWSGETGPWRNVADSTADPARAALARNYFCADGISVSSAAEAVAALRQPRRFHPGD